MWIGNLERTKFRVLQFVLVYVNIITVLGEYMKKYLFDKIVIDCSTIRFYPYRSTTFLEFFTTNFCGKLENDTIGKNTLCPKNLFEFIECLKRTKVIDKDYQILQYDTFSGENIDSSFDYLLKSFIKEVYKDKPANKGSIDKFCKRAYDIRSEAQKSAEVLNSSPEQFLDR